MPNIKITKREQSVLTYLKNKDWTSPTEIGGLFGGHSSVGSPLCKRLVIKGLLNRNNKGHYKL